MAYSYTAFTGNGSTTQYAVAFPYIRREHVAVTVAGIPSTFTWVNNSLIQMDAAPANGAAVRVYRTTPISAPLVDFADGATLVAADLDTNSRQSIYIQQELDDAQADNLPNVIPNGNKGDITTSVGGTVWAINNGAVTSAKILDGTIVNADVNAAAGITAGKLSFTQAGTGATARTVDSKLKDIVSVKDFGAIGDGTTNDIDALIAAHNTGKTVEYVSGETYYVEPSIGNLTRCIPILNNQKVLWNNCTIKCTNGARSVYKIDALSSTLNRHRSNIHCSDVRIWHSSAGTDPRDFEYFLTIYGGMIMNSTFENFSGFPNLSCRSIIRLDFNADGNGNPPNEAPDGLTFKNFYFLGSYGVSALVYMNGTGASSRAGKVMFDNLILGVSPGNPPDIDQPISTTGTGKNSVILLDNAQLHNSETSYLFGGWRTVQLTGGAFAHNCRFGGVYNELITPTIAAKQGLFFTDANSFFMNCEIDRPQLYVAIAAYSGNPSFIKMMDGRFYQCNVNLPLLSAPTNVLTGLPADVINLDAKSNGNRVDHILSPALMPSNNTYSDYSQKIITASQANNIKTWLEPVLGEYTNNYGLNPPDATNTIFNVKPQSIENKDIYTFTIVTTGENYIVQAGVRVNDASTLSATNYFSDAISFSGTKPLKITITLILDNTLSKADNLQTSVHVLWFADNGSSVSSGANYSSFVYTYAQDLGFLFKFSGVAASTKDLLLHSASIAGKRGEFYNKIASSAPF